MNVHPVVTSFLDAWKALDEEAYVAHFTEEFECIDPYGAVDSEEGLREHIRQLRKYWTDPDYDPAQRAFYYVRVLEVPSPRHSLFDALAAPQPLLPASAGRHRSGGLDR